MRASEHLEGYEFHHQDEQVELLSQFHLNEEKQKDKQIEVFIKENSIEAEDKAKQCVISKTEDTDDLSSQIHSRSEVVKITVFKGKIVEKEYLTIEGERISLKFE